MINRINDNNPQLRDQIQNRMQQAREYIQGNSDAQDTLQIRSDQSRDRMQPINNTEDATTGQPTSASDNMRGFFGNFKNDPASRVNDQEIVTKVRQAFFENNPNLNVRTIQVTSDDGTVTIRGIVLNPTEKSNAEAAIRNVDGVRSVSNKLSTQQN